MKECLFCHQKIDSSKKFCTKSCNSSYRTINLKWNPNVKKGFIKYCKICNKEFYVCKSIEKRQTCSKSCASTYVWNEKRERKLIEIECPECNKKFKSCHSILKLNKTGIKFCSLSCKTQAMRDGKIKWSFQNEGRTEKYLHNPYPRKQINGIRLTEHRRIMQEFLGRSLERWEVVHHINEDPKDNRIENLMLIDSSIHGKIHKKK